MATLPTYEEATSQPDPWMFIAPWIADSDLPSCCRVCQRFFDIFAPLLWAEPVRLLLRRPNVVQRLQRFHSTIQTARENVRNLAIILDLRGTPVSFQPRTSYALAEARGGNWLAAIFSQLPKLQFLVLDGHADFNDSALERASAFRCQSTPVLLSVADCRSLTAPSLRRIPAFLRSLLYLDISGTQRTTSIRSMFQLGELETLRVLKLRDLYLTDEDLSQILQRLGIRIWSLDVRNNRLTDDCIYTLSTNCFPPRLPATIQLGPDTGYTAETPLYTPAANHDVSEELQQSVIPSVLRPDETSSIKSYIQQHTQRYPSSYLGPDGLEVPLLNKVTGLTHLRIAGNKLSSQGVRSLLRATNRLQLLDVGSVIHTGSRPVEMAPYPTVRPYFQHDSTALLASGVSQQLQSLRIHHSVVTHAATILTAPHISLSKLLYLIEDAYPEFERQYGHQPFLPDTNPRITSLTLTDVPRYTRNGIIIDSLITFLRACSAQERAIAQAKAVNEQSRRAPRMLTGLRVLRLEFEQADRFASPMPTRSNHGSSHHVGDGVGEDAQVVHEESKYLSSDFSNLAIARGGSRVNNPFYANETSISGDADADAFTSASMSDFSFFEESQSRGQAGYSSLPPPPLSPAYKRSQVEPERFASQGPSAASPLSWGRSVVDALREFRARSKLAWETGQANEHWTGHVEVVM